MAWPKGVSRKSGQAEKPAPVASTLEAARAEMDAQYDPPPKPKVNRKDVTGHAVGVVVENRQKRGALGLFEKRMKDRREKREKQAAKHPDEDGA